MICNKKNCIEKIILCLMGVCVIHVSMSNAISELNNVVISGRCYPKDTCLQGIVKSNINVIYGRNGSGKSTLASGIDSLANSNPSVSDIEVVLQPELDESDRRSIFVYNEKFVEDTVKIREKGLNTMVMLGNQGELSEKLAEAKSQMQDLKYRRDDFLKEQQKVLNEIHECGGYIKKMLRLPGGWAETDSRLKKNRVKSSVTDDLLQELYDIRVDINHIQEGKILREINEWLVIEGNIPNDSLIELYYSNLSLDINEKSIVELCRSRIQRVEINERDEKIIDILSSRYNYINESKEYFSERDSGICPFCLREFSSSEKSAIYDLVNKFLRDESEVFRNKIANILQSISSVDEIKESREYYDLFSDLYRKIKFNRDDLNKDLLIIRDKLNDRISNLYDDYSDFNIPLIEDKVNDYNSSINELNLKIQEINEKIRDRKNRANYFIVQNKLIAAHRYRKQLEIYFSLISNCEKIVSDIEEVERNIEEKNALIQQIINKIKNTNIPVQIINQMLAFMFLDPNRLSLSLEGDYYKLLVNGKPIAPKQVSVGERNAIALSYFFASMGKNLNEEDVYKQPALIVLDDPVSSFDFDNRVGIFSALRWQIHCALSKNNGHRFLFLTHDFSILQDFSKICKQLIDGFNGKKCKKKNRKYTLGYFFMKDFMVDPIEEEKVESMGVYDDMLKQAYNYALAEDENHVLNGQIGNILRKILEAYSTFNYKQGPCDILQDGNIVSNLSEEDKLLYLNCMSRLILNSDSHMKEAAKALALNNERYFSGERIRIAKAVLKFLYHINPEHVRAYLDDSKCEVIKSWNLHVIK